MQEKFITKVLIKDVRNIKNFEIPLSETEKKHLIITGKNGSGKTSVLQEMAKFIEWGFIGQHIQHKVLLEKKIVEFEDDYTKDNNTFDSQTKRSYESEIKKLYELLILFGNTDITFNLPFEMLNDYEKGKFIFAYFGVKRGSQSFLIPDGVKKIQNKTKYDLNENVNKLFLQYLVNLKFDKLLAKDDNQDEKAQAIDLWFENFEKSLSKLFGTENIKLEFDKKDYNFLIFEDDKEPFTFNQMSDGYAAIIHIVSELIMRMWEQNTEKSYELEGLVLIDEIETHLHVDLQKKIFPFLTSFFPKIQFIITTHSPFVITSVQNVKICDLEHKIMADDLSAYSYQTIIEAYYGIDEYSNIIKEKLQEYEKLLQITHRTQEDDKKLVDLEIYFEKAPTLNAPELELKLKQLKKSKQNGSF